jgi:VWFA-related protein
MLRNITGIALLLTAVALSTPAANQTPQAAPNTTAPPAGAQSSPPSPAPASSAAAPSRQGSTPPNGKAQGDAPESATVLKITTRLVLIDAVITDKSGKPVLDLKPEDVQILENGKPQTVRSLALQKPDLNAKFEAAAPLAPWRFSNIPPFRPNAEPPTVLLLDALNTPATDQAYARLQMIKYIKTIEPGRRTAVYLLGTRLRMLQDFTTDPKLLLTAVDKKGHGISPLVDDNPDPSADTMPGASDAMVAMIDEFEAEEEAFRTDIRVAYTMDALQTISRNVSGYIGRKNLVWVSSAFPLSIGPDADSNNPFMSQRNYADVIHRTATMLTDAQVAVYPVDARGLVGSLMGGAESSGRTRQGRVRNGPQMAGAMSKASNALFDSHAAMNQIADETGGRAYYNRNDIDHAIATSIEDGSVYYTLGYYPEDKNWDGKFRKVQVKFTRSGLKVRARKGYYAVDPATPAAIDPKQGHREFVGALAFGTPDSTMLPFYAQITPLKDGGAAVNFLVDPYAISFEAANDGTQKGSFDFASVVYDRKGKVVTSASHTITTQLKPETFTRLRSSGLPAEERVTLAPGSYVVRMGVRDNRSGLIGTVTGRVEIQAPKS